MAREKKVVPITSAGKSRGRKPNTQPGRNGGTLKAGDNPGPWPGAGRPDMAFRERVEHIRNLILAGRAFEIVAVGQHSDVLSLLRYSTEYTEGKPTQTVGGDPDKPIVHEWRFAPAPPAKTG